MKNLSNLLSRSRQELIECYFSGMRKHTDTAAGRGKTFNVNQLQHFHKIALYERLQSNYKCVISSLCALEKLIYECIKGVLKQELLKLLTQTEM